MISQHGEQDNCDISLMALEQYLRFVRWIPRLEQEEETQLLERIERGKQERTHPFPDQQVLEDARQARDRLVEGFQPFIVWKAFRYVRRFRHTEVLDLVQEGNLGLLEAIERHRRKGLPLRALAGRCIASSMMLLLQRKDNLIRVPEKLLNDLFQLRGMRFRLMAELGRIATFQELAQAMGMSEDEVCALMVADSQCKVRSLQALSYEDGVDDKRLFHPLYPTAEMAPTTREGRLSQQVHQSIETVLSEKEQRVIRWRYGLSDEGGHQLTYREIGQRLGMGESGAATADMRAKKKLARVLESALAPLPEELIA